MIDLKLTIDLRGVGNDIPTRLGKSRPTLTILAYPSGRAYRHGLPAPRGGGRRRGAPGGGGRLRGGSGPPLRAMSVVRSTTRRALPSRR